MYRALGETVMSFIAKDWYETKQEYSKTKQAFYLSSEFLMGRALGNNLINLGIDKEIQKFFKELGIDYNQIEDEEELKALKEKIHRIINSLTPRQKEIIYLRFLHQKEYEEIKELAARCRYPVRFAGCVPQMELAKLYNNGDIFVLPSMYEGLPLTVIESLACGDRVVMTRLDGVTDWLEDMLPDADIRYVDLPKMKGADEAAHGELLLNP